MVESDCRKEWRVLDRATLFDCGWGAIKVALFPSELEACLGGAFGDNTCCTGKSFGSTYNGRVIPV